MMSYISVFMFQGQECIETWDEQGTDFSVSHVLSLA